MDKKEQKNKQFSECLGCGKLIVFGEIYCSYCRDDNENESKQDLIDTINKKGSLHIPY
jgi:uncharacterized OB-fold protein